ncbi:hypothetical protein JTE90_026501 [Oedothorax gibbosus]|uniref:G-protein coupled receptors family 1 profile domain-containing protein n=1 Tax=Oedothorax gibbosus TaxID=931172 RepID=A0AAV6VPU2_9ARAC|nr:hypothetical protein JTE90_026501 [Oedothorax gibbosus]
MAPNRELEEISLPLGNKISDIAIIIINLTETDDSTWNVSSEWANGSMSEPMSGYDYLAAIVKGTILATIILLTILGNTLVLLAVSFTPNLRSTTNIFIVNLAIADLLLGVFVLPFSAFIEMNAKQWIFGGTFCSVWAAVDVLCCSASIISLCVISVDRYVGVTRPLAYSNIVTHSRAVIACFCIWFLSTAISVGPILGWKEPQENPLICEVNKQMGYVLFSVSFSFYVPCLVIFFVYFRIYKAAVKQTKFLETGVKVVKTTGHETTKELTLRVHAGAHHVLSTAARNGNYGDKTSIKVTMANLQGRLAKFKRQKKAAKTLGIVVGVFILCWFPFFLVLPLGTICEECHVPQALFDTFFWTGYLNSCLNPIIYACSSRDFKRAFRHVLKCAGSDRNLQSFRARTINFTLRSTRRTPKAAQEKMTFDVTKLPPLIQPQYSLDSESPGSLDGNNYEDELPPSYQSLAAPTIAEAIRRVNSVIRPPGSDTDCTNIGVSE